MTKAAWIDRFAGKLGSLLPWADPDELIALGTERWETMSEIEPGQAARSECDEWPPNDG